MDLTGSFLSCLTELLSFQFPTYLNLLNWVLKFVTMVISLGGDETKGGIIEGTSPRCSEVLSLIYGFGSNLHLLFSPK